MTDDTAPDQNDDDAIIGPMIEETLATFVKSAQEQDLDAVTVMMAAVKIAAGMGDMIFQGMVPEVPVNNRADVEKIEFLATYVDMIDETLAATLSLPVNLSVEDDEEINPAEFMPGLNRVH